MKEIAFKVLAAMLLSFQTVGTKLRSFVIWTWSFLRTPNPCPNPWNWADRLFIALGLHPLVGSIVLGALAYGCLLGAAVLVGKQRVFLDTPLMLIACASISYVLYTLHWGPSRFFIEEPKLRGCFQDGSVEYQEIFLEFTTALPGFLGPCLCGLVFLVPAVIAFVLGLWFGQIDRTSHLLPMGWYESDQFASLSLLTLLACSLSLVGGTGTWLLVRNAWFLWRIRKLEAIALFPYLLTQLKSLTFFYFKASLFYLAAVGVFGYVLSKGFSILSLSVLFFAASIGLLTAVFPQWIFHKLLSSSAARVDGLAVSAFRAMGLTILLGPSLLNRNSCTY